MIPSPQSQNRAIPCQNHQHQSLSRCLSNLAHHRHPLPLPSNAPLHHTALPGFHFRRVNENAGRSDCKPFDLCNPMNDPALSDTAPTDPLEDDIARLAYQYYEEEGCPEGCALEHWVRAEQNLRGIPPWPAENGAGDA